MSMWIEYILSHFSFCMFVLAFIMICFHKIIKSNLSFSEIVYRWIALFPLGFSGIYAFIMHAFYSDIAAQTIGWTNSPFQFEVAMANLGFGVIAILSFRATYGFRLATVIGNTCWLWGDAAGHIYQMIINHNFSVGNAGSWFWMDLILPLLLIICIINLKQPKSSVKKYYY